MSALRFEDALSAIRNGAHTLLNGSTLTVNGVSMAITEDQFEEAWDAMGPLEAEDVISLNPAFVCDVDENGGQV